MTFPVPVTLNRFAALLTVFLFDFTESLPQQKTMQPITTIMDDRNVLFLIGFAIGFFSAGTTDPYSDLNLD
jgi:hypothetical protein